MKSSDKLKATGKREKAHTEQKAKRRLLIHETTIGNRTRGSSALNKEGTIKLIPWARNELDQFSSAQIQSAAPDKFVTMTKDKLS